MSVENEVIHVPWRLNKFIYSKNINILYSYDMNFYHVIKWLLILVLKLHIFFELYMILMSVRNQKTTINNKIRATEQIFVLGPVKQNILE